MRKSFGHVVFFLISEEACQNFTQPVVHKEPKVGCDEVSRVSLPCTKFGGATKFSRTKFPPPCTYTYTFASTCTCTHLIHILMHVHTRLHTQAHSYRCRPEGRKDS